MNAIDSRLFRRNFFSRSAAGLGSVALASMLSDGTHGACGDLSPSAAGVPGVLRELHHAPKAKRVQETPVIKAQVKVPEPILAGPPLPTAGVETSAPGTRLSVVHAAAAAAVPKKRRRERSVVIPVSLVRNPTPDVTMLPYPVP